MRDQRTLARLQFATWLKETHPEIYERAITAAEAATETGLGVVGPPANGGSNGFWSKFTEVAAGLGTTYLTLKNQRDAMKLNLERAKQGQPPLDIATTAPVVRTQVAIDPATARQLASTAGEGLNRVLLYGGLGLVAILLMRRFA